MRRSSEGVVLAEHGAMAGKKPLDVAVADPLERLDESGDIRTVMRVDISDASVSIDVVAGEEQIAQAERQLAVRVSRRVPHFDLSAPHVEDVAFVDRADRA